ncbi:MAG: 4Fe-4S dicluster domain-containing protein, partial [Microvirgula sp.]
ILGGPMMGLSAPSLDIPVTKGLSGILVFPSGSLPVRERRSCIRCGQCLDVCPMGLNPSLLGQLAAKQEYALSARHGVLDCIECGACTQGCPSGIPLLQYNRVSKSMLRQRRPS